MMPSLKMPCHFDIYFAFRSSKTTEAALRPGAPITPPPGWAPLPQRYSPFTGVL